MTRSAKLLPIASIDGPDPEFDLSDKDWDQLEKAIGGTIPDATRDEIVKVTTSFVYFEPFERAAQKAKPVDDYLARVSTEANGLHQLLFQREPEYGHILIDQFFTDPRISRHQRHALGGILSSLIVACRQARQELAKRPGHQEGECWDRWVLALTRIVGAAKLPTSSTNRANDGPSAFVKFVYRLQSAVPKASRRSHTYEALARAINRARKSPVGQRSARPKK